MAHPEEIRIIHGWLDAMADTIRLKDLNRHMDLVSKKVEVFGNPSKENINYAGWHKRRKNEFDNRSVVCASYANTKIKTITQVRIIFNVDESIVSTNGRIIALNKDVILEREDDGKWRVVEENIHTWKQQQMNEDLASNG